LLRDTSYARFSIVLSGAVTSYLFMERLSPLGTLATAGPTVPASDDDDDCGADGGM
jgi:hypothetical protein